MNDEGEEDFELVSKMAELYDKLGISVYDANGELKNTFGLLESLAEVYPTLTNAEKAYVTETIAGKYQAQNAAAILNNFQTALDATATAYDSTGSAARENEKVLDSIEGKIASFSSAFEELSQNLIGSDLIKNIVDLGTALLNIANIELPFGKNLIEMAPYALAVKALIPTINQLRKSYNDATASLGAFTSKQVATKALSQQGVNAYSTSLRNEIALILQEKGAYDASSGAIKASTVDKLQNKLATAGLSTSQQALVISTISETTATTASTAAIVAKTIAVKALQAALTLGLSYAISLVVEGVGALINWITGASESFEEMSDRITEASSKYEETANGIDDVIDSYKSLKEALDEKNISEKETESIKAQLTELETQLIDQYDLEASKLDLVNGKYEDQLELLENIKKEKAQSYLNEVTGDIHDLYIGGVDTFAGNFTGVTGENEKILKEIFSDDYENKWTFGDGNNTGSEWLYNELQKYLTDLRTKYNKAVNSGDEKQAEKLKKQISQLSEYASKIKEQADLAEETLSNVANIYIDENEILSEAYDKYLNGSTEKGWYDNVHKELEKMLEDGTIDEDTASYIKMMMYNMFVENKDAIKGEVEDIAEEQVDAYQQAAKNRAKEDKLSFDDLFIDIGDGDTNGEYISDFYARLKELADGGKLTKDSIIDVVNEMGNFKIVNDDVVYGLDGTTMSLDDLLTYFYQFNDTIEDSEELLDDFNEQLDAIQSAYDTVQQAVEEYNENGYLTLDTFQELSNLGVEYLQYLFDENGQLQLNEKAFRNLAIAQLENLKVQKAAELMAYAKTLAKEGDQISENEQKINNLAAALQNYNDEQARGILLSAIEGELTDNELADLDKKITAYSEYVNLINGQIKNISSGRTSIGSSSSSKSSSKSSSSSKEWWEEELDKLKQQFDYSEITIEEYIAGLNNLLGRVEKGSDAWREINDLLQEQRLDKVENDYKQGIISLDEYINRLKELIKVYKQGTQAWDGLADKIKDALQDKLDQQKDDLETAEDAAIGLIDEEIEKLEELRDAEEERYDQLIADKEAANEETERELELARLEEALENAKNEKVKRVWVEGLGWQWQADQEAIKEAQEALDEFNQEEAINDLEQQKEDALAAIDEQINGWEDYKEAWESVVDDYETEQERLILAQKLGAEIENQILQQKIEAVNKYKEQYLNTMKELQRWEEDPVGALSNHINISTGNTTGADAGVSTGTGGSSVSSAPSLQKGANVSVKSGTRWYSTSYGGGASGVAHDGTIKYINTKGSHPYNIDGKGWVKKTDIVGYKNGGVVDYTGLAMLHGTPSSPEFVLNNEQAKKIMSMIMNPHVKTNSLSGGNTTNNYNFGDIELPNVHNAQQFMSELKSLVNTTRHQAG